MCPVIVVEWSIERNGAREDLGHNDITTGGFEHALNKVFGLTNTPALDNAEAWLGVGDSTTPFSVAQTDLQASTNKVYRHMDATYPSRVGQTVTLRATFPAGVASFAWREYGILWSGTAGAGSPSGLFSRRVQNLGTKAAGDSWILTAAVTLS